MRTFKPVSKWCGRTNVRTCVDRWEYTEGRRLYVVHLDGSRYRCEYPGLRALRSGENIVEVLPA